jgi:hypothetical protein
MNFDAVSAAEPMNTVFEEFASAMVDYSDFIVDSMIVSPRPADALSEDARDDRFVMSIRCNG